jgi:hypothetical protein
MLIYAAADFEDFVEPRPDLPASLEEELTKVVTLQAEKRWPFRIHATYNETITRVLLVSMHLEAHAPESRRAAPCMTDTLSVTCSRPQSGRTRSTSSVSCPQAGKPAEA